MIVTIDYSEKGLLDTIPLIQQHCQAYSDDQQPLTAAACTPLLSQLDGDWTLSDDAQRIDQHFTFKNYGQTIAFVNAVAWIANREDHHPDLEVSYRHCRVHYTTHSLGGLSHNDFICAAKIDALIA